MASSSSANNELPLPVQRGGGPNAGPTQLVRNGYVLDQKYQNWSEEITDMLHGEAVLWDFGRNFNHLPYEVHGVKGGGDPAAYPNGRNWYNSYLAYGTHVYNMAGPVYNFNEYEMRIQAAYHMGRNSNKM